MSRLVRTPGQTDAVRPRGVSATGIARPVKVGTGRPDYAVAGSRAVRQHVATARPITEGDIPRNGRLVIVAPEPVWSFDGTARPDGSMPDFLPERAYRAADGRMRENRNYAGRRLYGRLVSRDLESGGKRFSSDSTWADLVAAYNPKNRNNR